MNQVKILHELAKEELSTDDAAAFYELVRELPDVERDEAWRDPEVREVLNNYGRVLLRQAQAAASREVLDRMNERWTSNPGLHE